MKNEKSHNASSFWSGFTLGAGIGASALVLFGTRKGRLFLRKLLDASEKIEADLENVIDYLSNEHGANNQNALDY